MGGLLFNLGRVDRQRYDEILAQLKPYLDQKFGNYYKIPRFYHNKPDFGDMDILVSTKAIQGNWQDLKKEIVEDLQVVHKSLGHILSINYMNFQVDFFCISEKYFESTYNFLCFNDLGNLIGKIAKKFNLKYGEEGLSYIYRREDEHYQKDILISQDLAKICSFFQLDYAKWQAGFESLEEMFQWILQSPYFSVVPYYKIAGNMEKRAQERKTIKAFIEWLISNNITQAYDFLTRDAYLPMIAAHFPESDLLTKIEEEKEREAIVNKIKEKFNGAIIMQLLPLQGKSLGDFITKFKTNFGEVAAFEKYILENDKEDIEKEIVRFYTQSFK